MRTETTRVTRILVAILMAALLASCGGSGVTPEGDSVVPGDDTTGGEDSLPGECVDIDGDGYFEGDGCQPGLVQDCDDIDGTVNPGAVEVCGDGKDQDCDGQDEPCPGECVDMDKDGYFVGDGCQPGQVTDCNDGDGAIHPGAEEVCGDGVDQDCKGGDEECAGPCKDADGDGHFAIAGDCPEGDDCDDANHFAYPGANEICGDGIDQDCAGGDMACPEQCDDDDGDGYGDGPDCIDWDCNDANPDVHLGAAEICGNGIDDDCMDGDEACPQTCEDEDEDGFGVGGACDVQDCDDEDPNVNPAMDEICGDGTDQDCDGVDPECVTCDDPDGDGYGEGEDCDGPDCNEADPDANPGATEICGDGVDNDCDGEDEECVGVCDDGDNDGYGDGDGCLGPDCNDEDPFVNPGADEICENGLDDDCAGGDADCPPPTCESDWDCGAQQICDLASGTCKAPKVWEWWAPTFYVDTDDSHPGWNMPVAVNFDGNWDASDNAQNIDTGSKDGVIYYSFVKTSTHWYLGYYMYFPRRWSGWFGGTEYDNAMTGVLLVIEQDGSTLGKLVLMETFTESTFYQYTPAGSALSGAASVDGDVNWDLDFPTDHHPLVYVHSQDHDCYGDAYFWNNVDNWDVEGFPGDDGVIYRFGNLAEAPDGISDAVTYRLDENKSELWAKRSQIGAGQLFDEFGHWNPGLDDDARSQAPWRIHDENEVQAPEGEVLYNPADLVRRHFAYGWGAFSHKYVYNPYANMVEMYDLLIKATADVFDGPADPYVNLIMCDGGGYNVLTLSNFYAWQNNWMAWDVEPATLLDMEAELDGRNFFYGLPHPDCDVVGVEVRDYDDLSGDDWLMDVEETHWYDFSGQQLVDWGKSDSVIEITPAP